jgi:hypothetical protein
MSVPAGTSEAIEQLRLYFAPLATRQGILAREALGHPAPDDEALAGRLIDRMRAETRADGSVAGGIVATVWRAHELLDLRRGADQSDWVRVMGWVLERQDKPGAFSEGCTPARHSYRACEHFISGFFSPAPPAQRIAPIMLPNGKVYRAEPAARFAISCLALRAALRGGLTDRVAIERHTVSLVHLQNRWNECNGYFAADVIVAAVHTLAYVTGPRRDEVPQLAAVLAANQAEDGTWPNADFFHTIEALLAIGTAEARTVLRRAVPALLARQRTDGGFGSTAQQERALIALRALIWVEQEG